MLSALPADHDCRQNGTGKARNGQTRFMLRKNEARFSSISGYLAIRVLYTKSDVVAILPVEGSAKDTRIWTVLRSVRCSKVGALPAKVTRSLTYSDRLQPALSC